MRAIRATLPWLREMSLSGVWRVLQRAGLHLRAARIQQDSPEPGYGPKREALLACLREAAWHPDEFVLVFLDEMG
jgi:hypothetical protein